MAELTQTVKIRLEVGPGMPRDIGAFTKSPAKEAMLAAFCQALTAERIYPGPEAAFEAVRGGVTAKVWVKRADIGSEPKGGGFPRTNHVEMEADVTLEGVQPEE